MSFWLSIVWKIQLPHCYRSSKISWWCVIQMAAEFCYRSLCPMCGKYKSYCCSKQSISKKSVIHITVWTKRNLQKCGTRANPEGCLSGFILLFQWDWSVNTLSLKGNARMKTISVGQLPSGGACLCISVFYLRIAWWFCGVFFSSWRQSWHTKQRLKPRGHFSPIK